jgi:phosphoribosylformylglycinamidine synthase
VALLGTTRDEMGASEYLATVLGRDDGPCPSLDLASARAVVNLLVEIAVDGMIHSAHDLSSGGLAVALAEASAGGLGAVVNIGSPLSPTRALFAESASRAVVSLPSGRERNLVDAARRHGVAVSLLGRVVPGRVTITVNGDPAIDLPVSRIAAVSEESFARLVEVRT